MNKKILPLFMIFFLLLSIFLVGHLTGIREQFTLENIRGIFQENYWISLIFFVVLFALGNFLQIPGIIFLAAAVLTFGKVIGAMTIYFTAVISCCVIYFVINRMGKNTLREIDSTLMKNLLKKIDQYPMSIVIFLRLIFQTVPILNYALALSGISFRTYLLGTIIGLPLPIFVYCFYFDQLYQYLF